MGRFVKGDIVVIPFPFSDLSAMKKRPAFVVAVVSKEDLILCQITSKFKDFHSIKTDSKDFENGNLPIISYIRPNKLFTADKNLILFKIGHLKEKKTREVIQKIVDIILM